MKPEIFGEPALWELGPLPITPAMLTSLAASLALVVMAVLLSRAVVHRPSSRLAAAGRLTVGFVGDLVTEVLGRPSPRLEIFAGSLFLFIAAAALLGQLPGLSAPTADLGAASALAVLVFLAVPVAGIHSRGPLGYLRHYLTPNPLLFPLHVISELSRTLALALRLFGNMMSGHLVVGLIVALAGLLVPVPLMVLDLLIGFLQAYIFTILTCVYIGAAIQVGQGEESK